MAENFLGATQDMREKIWEGRPHYCKPLFPPCERAWKLQVWPATCSSMCAPVRPPRSPAPWRRHRFVQWGLDQAENFGLPAYLEASVYGYPLYLKMGFHEINTITVKAEKWDGSRDMNYVVILKNPRDITSSIMNGFEVSNSD